MLLGCTRSDFSVVQVIAYPMVVTTYTEGKALRSEGVALALEVEPLEDTTYHIAVTSPSKTYSWETVLYPFEAHGIILVGVPDLLLPYGIGIEKGTWQVELFHSDGRKRTSSFTISQGVDKENLDAPFYQWDVSDDGLWVIDLKTAENEAWHIAFFDFSGRMLDAVSYTGKPIELSATQHAMLEDSTFQIVCSRYDEDRGCLVVSRTIK